MAELRIGAERAIDAPAGRVYGYIADYRQHHQHFLPPAFSNYRVEEGGVGAGTVIKFDLTVMGRVRKYHQRIEEPEPGRVITEGGADGTTSFTVTPEGGRCRVRIETTWEGKGGMLGSIERMVASRILMPLYNDELARLDRYARERAAGG
jgi:uncharacterized protein YndB with AHSA1/START domain